MITPAEIKSYNMGMYIVLTVIPACVVFTIIVKKWCYATRLFELLVLSGIYLMLCGAVGCIAENSVYPPPATSYTNAPLVWQAAFNLRKNLTDPLGTLLLINLLAPLAGFVFCLFKHKEIQNQKAAAIYLVCLAILAIIMVVDNFNDHFMSR